MENHHPTPRRRQPITFVRGRRLYQIAPDRSGEAGYVGYCDGRVLARAADKAAVARVLIASGNA